MSKLKVTTISDPDNDNTAMTVSSTGDVSFSGDISVTGTIPASQLTGTLPAIDGSALTGLSSGGLVFISRAVASNDATIEFTGLDNSAYESYLFTFTNIIPSADDDFQVHTSADGGSTFTAYTSMYLRGVLGNIYHNTSTTGDLVHGSIESTSDGMSGQLTIFNPSSSLRTQGVFENLFVESNNGSFVTIKGTLYNPTVQADDAIQFKCSTANIQSGTITMYGMVNS